MRINQQDTQHDELGRVIYENEPFTGEVETTEPDGRVIELASYQEGIQQDPQQLAQAARTAFDQGALERSAGNVEAARSAFERAVATGDPEIGPMALANLAVLEASAGRIAQARAAFEQAIATGHPDHAPKSLFNFAIFQQRNGELAHARELYEQAVAGGHPEHARKALFNLANLAVQQGRVSEACGLFLRAMEPPFLGDTAARAHRRLLEVDSGRLAEACEVYVRAIADAKANGDEQTAAQARSLLHDLDPQYGRAERTIEVGNRTFKPADIESAEWATGRRPGYGSGYLDVYTRDGQQHTVFVDLGDPHDRQGYDALRELLGPGEL
ncbi:tetratricopeptide repeat protein [Kitasatospora kifunensis]|uniref:Tetratricopeptide (TPR) repeat protein n=1 Tax=Kitasatospora kifunensis TaxID=58351 RepID=A0A7W7R6P2_KITKI|nr:tetratricopeptide repeat protein [Kitasatospora kifunensis]MBB4926407.1 tetratricopeptide (TPR) repeat protein [Kitasatospora kifunensis]